MLYLEMKCRLPRRRGPEETSRRVKTAPDEIFFASDRSAALEASGILLEGMPRVYTVQILAVMVAILNHSTKK